MPVEPATQEDGLCDFCRAEGHPTQAQLDQAQVLMERLERQLGLVS